MRWIVGASVFGAIAGMAVALLCVSGEWLPAAGIVGAWGSAGCWTMAGTSR